MATLLGVLLAAFFAIAFLEGFTVPFSIGTFSLLMPPHVLGLGLTVGFVLGIVGALPPAAHCLRTALPIALRSSG